MALIIVQNTESEIGASSFGRTIIRWLQLAYIWHKGLKEISEQQEYRGGGKLYKKTSLRSLLY